MTRSRSGNPARRAWVPMTRRPLNPQYPTTPEGAYRGDATITGHEAWGNHLYDGVLTRFSDGTGHFSFKRRDRAAVRDWRHFQAIKNEVWGAGFEAVELFPDEGHLVDEANQYHLWLLPADAYAPIGFVGRTVLPSADDYDRSKVGTGQPPGGRQRGWEPGLPTGLGNDTRPVVLCVRHPDASNDFTAWPGDGEPIILDLDLGSSFDGTPDDAEDWSLWAADQATFYDEPGLSREHPAWHAFSQAVHDAHPDAS